MNNGPIVVFFSYETPWWVDGIGVALGDGAFLLLRRPARGYDHSLMLDSIEIGYRMQKDKFAKGEDVEVTIGFGHTGMGEPIDEYRDLPFCLFLD